MSEIFSTVGVFQYSAEAQIIKGRLEAEGIETFLADNHTIDTDPLVSNAIGGVKLKVYKKDQEQALQVLESVNKYSVDEDGEQISCPKCHGEKVELFSSMKGLQFFFFLCLSFLIYVLPMNIRREYHCATCNHKFKFK